MVGYYRLNELGYVLPAGVQVLPAAAVEAAKAATGLLAAAEERATEIVRGAEEAYEAERRRGYADGLAQAGVEAVERLLAEGAALDQGLREMEVDLGHLVAGCVRKLAADFDDHARAEAVVRGALRQMRRERRSELRVAPTQFAALREAVGRIISEFPEVELVDVVEDSSLVPPRNVLESRVGRVEADFDATLADYEAILRGAIASVVATDSSAMGGESAP